MSNVSYIMRYKHPDSCYLSAGARFENSLMLTKAVMERHALDTTTALTLLHVTNITHVTRDISLQSSEIPCLFLYLLCC